MFVELGFISTNIEFLDGTSIHLLKGIASVFQLL